MGVNKHEKKLWRCNSCEYRFKPIYPSYSCPKCKSSATFPIKEKLDSTLAPEIKMKIDENINSLKRSSDYKLISKFVNKNEDKFKEWQSKPYTRTGILAEPLNNEIKKLMRLLISKQYYIDEYNLKNIIFEEYHNQLYEDFIFPFNVYETDEVDYILKIYVDLYWNDLSSKLEFLRLLLEKNGHVLSLNQIKEKLLNIKNSMDLKLYEMNLLNEEKNTELNLDQLSGLEFEQYLENLFRKLGYNVRNLQHTQDQGADLFIEKYGEKTVVQAKRYTSSVGNSAIQEIVASIKYYGADTGMVVTNSYFTPQAIELAKVNNIKLVDREELEKIRNGV